MRRYLVTITDNIAPTSMPYNEFVLYRHQLIADEKQIVILLFKTKVNEIEALPADLELHCVGKNIKKLLVIVNDVVTRAEKDGAKIVFHIHEAKSVLLFNIATGGKYIQQVLYTLHNTYKNYSFHNKLFSQLASRQCGQVICVSKTSYKYYPKELKQKLGKKVSYIQNGVDTERIKAVVKEDIKNEVFTIVYVARMVDWKRHKLLIDAAKNVPGIRLKLIGTGPIEEDLKKQAEGFDVIFTGLMPRDVVYKELKTADAYASPSSYEGLPISVLEAMACGLPCVLSNIEQHREIAEKCNDLIICSEDEWTQVLKKLTMMDHNHLKDIGNTNAADVEENFSLASMHRKYERVYLKIER